MMFGNGPRRIRTMPWSKQAKEQHSGGSQYGDQGSGLMLEGTMALSRGFVRKDDYKDSRLRVCDDAMSSLDESEDITNRLRIEITARSQGLVINFSCKCHYWQMLNLLFYQKV